MTNVEQRMREIRQREGDSNGLHGIDARQNAATDGVFVMLIGQPLFNSVSIALN